MVDSFFAEGGKYVGLASLDLICDTEDSFDEWIKGVSISYPRRSDKVTTHTHSLYYTIFTANVEQLTTTM